MRLPCIGQMPISPIRYYESTGTWSSEHPSTPLGDGGACHQPILCRLPQGLGARKHLVQILQLLRSRRRRQMRPQAAPGAGRGSGGMPAPPAVGPGQLASRAYRCHSITMPTRTTPHIARGRPRPSSEASIADCRRRAIAEAKRRRTKVLLASANVT